MSEVSSPSDFKKSSGSARVPLKLPSGNTALVRRPGLQTFMAKGMIPNSLMGVMQKAVEEKNLDDESLNKEMTSFLENPDKLRDMLSMVDAVTVYCVVEPKVWPEPPDGEERDEDLLYVDEVDGDDKMFIFNWAVGGSPDVSTFLEQQAERVESLPAGQDVGKSAKRAPGARKR